MREAFGQELSDIEAQVLEALRKAATVLGTVAEAVLECDASKLATITTTASELRRESRTADTGLLTVVARQAPVAGDLRVVLALIQLAQHQGRIANQFELIADQLAQLDGGSADRQGTAQRLSRMALLVADQLHAAADAFALRDVDLAEQVEIDDDAIDALNREIFQASLDLDLCPNQSEIPYRHVLLARSLERMGDNAVDVAEQAAFVKTRQLREFTDASRSH